MRAPIEEREIDSTDAFLARCTSAAQAGQLQAAIVSIHTRIAELCMSGNFRECDAMLRAIDPTKIGGEMMLSFYMATASCSDLLEYRAAFAGKLRAKLEEELGTEEASEILRCIR